MKIAILNGPRDLQIEDQELDPSKLADDEIWVKTRISAFKIGTDRGNYEGADQVPGAPGYPRWVGDSNLGNRAGRWLQSDPGKGRRQHCDARASHQSEYIMSGSESLVVIPEGVADEDAVYAHLYALSAHCYHKAQFRPGENVAVVGVGVLGLGAIALGPLFGGRVVGIANSPVRMEMSDRMGAHANFLYNDPQLEAKLDEFTRGQGIDLVILTANPWPAFRTAMQIVRPNGRVSVVSLLGRGEPPLDFNPLAMELFYNKGTSVIAVSERAGYLYPNAGSDPYSTADRYAWDNIADHVVSLMADGGLEPSRLITHRFHYSEMVEAYEMAYHREKNMLGVIFNWQE